MIFFSVEIILLFQKTAIPVILAKLCAMDLGIIFMEMVTKSCV